MRSIGGHAHHGMREPSREIKSVLKNLQSPRRLTPKVRVSVCRLDPRTAALPYTSQPSSADQGPDTALSQGGKVL